MLTDHDVITLLRKQVQDLQECIMHMAENQLAIVKAGMLTNQAIVQLAVKIDEMEISSPLVNQSLTRH